MYIRDSRAGCHKQLDCQPGYHRAIFALVPTQTANSPIYDPFELDRLLQ